LQPLTITNEKGEKVVLYEPTPKQQEFHMREEANCLFWGGRGSGKSMALRWEAHARALSHPGFKYLIVRRTYPELEKSHLTFMTEEMRKLGGTYNKTEKIAYYPNGSTGRFSHCAGEEDVLNLLGSEFYWMGFDELSTFEWDMFTRLSVSVRVTKGSGLTALVRATTNPLGPSAEEILHYFVDKDVDPEEDADYNPDDWYAIKANAEENPYLDLEQYKKRFAGLALHVRKAWVDGEFTLENAMFDVQPQKTVYELGSDGEPTAWKKIPYHYIDRCDVDSLIKNAQIYRAYDHGYFPDPAVCLWIAHLGNRYIVFHETLYKKVIAPDIAEHIVATSKDLGIKRVVATYCDPTVDINTGADVLTIKDIMERKGLPLDCSVNNREHYASAIHSALGEEVEPNLPRIQIYTKGCPYLAKTLPKQRFDEKHPLRMANSKTDHATIALAYFLISSGAMERSSFVSPATIKPWMKSKGGERWVLGTESTKTY
jgi:hypothetical protein